MHRRRGKGVWGDRHLPLSRHVSVAAPHARRFACTAVLWDAVNLCITNKSSRGSEVMLFTQQPRVMASGFKRERIQQESLYSLAASHAALPSPTPILAEAGVMCGGCGCRGGPPFKYKPQFSLVRLHLAGTWHTLHLSPDFPLFGASWALSLSSSQSTCSLAMLLRSTGQGDEDAGRAHRGICWHLTHPNAL